jgi:hypothetical protein
VTLKGIPFCGSVCLSDLCRRRALDELELEQVLPVGLIFVLINLCSSIYEFVEKVL